MAAVVVPIATWVAGAVSQAALAVGITGQIGGYLTIAAYTATEIALYAGMSYAIDAVTRPEIKPPGSELTLNIDPAYPREMIIGERQVGGSVVARYSRDVNNYFAHLVIQIADHPCVELSKIYDGGRLVQGTPLTHGVRTEITAYSNSGGPRLWMTWHDGRPGQTADSDLVTKSATDPEVVAGKIDAWTSDHKGAGCAYVHIEMRWDPDILTSIPQFTFLVKGAKLYDRRKDSTAGGSGAHRHDDPATWEYSTNAMVALDHFLLGYKVESDPLAFGIGLSKVEVPYDQFAAAADLCDEDVETGVGGAVETIKRYAANGVISAGDYFQEVIEAFQVQMAARVVDLGGRIGILGAEERAITVSLTEDDLISGEPLQYADKLDFADLIGSVTGTFSDPANNYQPTPYDPLYTQYQALPDGGEAQAVTLTLPYEVHPRRAARLVSAYAARETLQPRLAAVFKPKAWTLEAGDWFEFTSPRLQVTAAKFEVVDIVKNDDFTVIITARAIDPNFLAFDNDNDPDLSVPPDIAPYERKLETPTFTPSASTISGGGAVEPVISITNGTLNPVAREIVYEVREWTGAAFTGPSIFFVAHADETVSLLRQGVKPGAKYKVRMKVRAGTRESDWSDWSSEITIGATYTVPLAAAAASASAGSALEIAIAAAATSSDDAAAAAAASAATAATAATNAATAQAAAATSATSAATQATNAAASAVTAAGAATSATGSATAAAGSATSASNSATTAAGSATSAASSASAAAASATAASGSASAASTSASAANTSATNAGTSASAAAASSVSAQSVANRLIPDRPSVATDYVAASGAGAPGSATALSAGSVVAVAGEGDVRQFSGLQSVFTRGGISPVSGRTYRHTVRARVTADGTGNRIRVAFWIFDSSWASLGVVNLNTIDPSFVVADGWQTFTADTTGAAILAAYPTAAHVRAWTVSGENSGGTSSGSTWQLAVLGLADVTSESAAAGSATAAATSASSAATSASGASTSASAASTSATNAATSAGAASTSATNASNSATTAAGHAATASTQATNAANSATAAGGSATAASGSASTASTQATNAANSATAAAASAVTAASQAANASTSATSAATSATTATTQASNAASSASAASTSATNAATSAGNASTSATSASNSATTAAGHAATASTQATNAATSATAAAGSATAASGSASTASTQATNASNSATAAAASAVTAASQASNAASSASAASTSASTATTQASNAATSASAAATSATNASTSAGAASTSASNASSSATTAAGHASTASTQATNAATSATAAAGSATAASGSASSASTSATNAGNSATAAANSAVSAQSVANNLAPNRPSVAADFTNSLGTGTPGSIGAFSGGTVVAVAGEGDVRQVTAVTVIATRGWLPIVSGATYRRRYRSCVTVDGTANVIRAGMNAYDASGASLGYPTFNTDDASHVAADGWVTTDVTATAAAILAAYPTAAYVRAFAIFAGTSGGSSSGATVQVSIVEIANVTSEAAAAASATAAATSASSASTSASGASTSASAAATSATSAATSAGSASTSATNASNSATTAAGHASTASTQATNAANSATAAAGSATAASGSASSASTSATNAGNSATAAASSAVTAQSVANRLIPERPAIAADFSNSGTGSGTPDTLAAASSGSVQTVANEGDVRQYTSAINVVTRGWLPVGSGKTFSLTSRTAVTVDGTSNALYQGFPAYAADGTYLGIVGLTAVDAAHVAADGWQQFTTTTTSATILAAFSTAAYIRGRVNGGRNSGGTSSSTTWQCGIVRLQDTTSEAAASTSASAAATSASNASTSASGAATSASAASTSATAAATSASGASTSAGTATTQASAASASAAAASASASLSATYASAAGVAGLLPNPKFMTGVTGGIPNGWANSANATAGTQQARPGASGAYIYRLAGGAATNNKIKADTLGATAGAIVAARRYIARATTILGSGTYNGAGLIIDWINSGGSTISSESIGFANTATTNGATANNHTGLTAWEVPVTAPTNAVRAVVHACSHDSSLNGGNGTANSIDWYEVDLVPETYVSAGVQTNSSAIAGINGAAAFWETIVSASGGDLAAVRLKAGASGSYLELISSVLRLANVSNDAVIEVMRAVGGEAFFSRPISADSASRRVTIGPGYGVSGSEVVLWFGPVATAPSAQSRTNGYFALGTDGKVYVGTADASTSNTPLTVGFSPSSVNTTHTTNTPLSQAVTATPAGGSGTYTYVWAVGDVISGGTPTLSNRYAATCTVGVTHTAIGTIDGNISCTVTDTVTGKVVTKYWGYYSEGTGGGGGAGGGGGLPP